MIRVMSFNLRYGTADDGANGWPHRRELVSRTLRQAAPDLLGVQEALDFQLEYLAGQLPELEFFGAGRDDGRRQGEFAAIYLRRARFEFVDGGHFWLSETPDVPGSRSWETSQPRMATWVRLHDRRAADADLVVFNTHFDQRSELARIESARLLRRRIDEMAGRLPVIVTGDFNATEDDVPYRMLLHADGERPAFIDAYRSVHTERSEDELTRQNFEATTRGSRIDWILHSPHLRATRAEILRQDFGGRFPSDHYPVTAELIRSANVCATASA